MSIVPKTAAQLINDGYDVLIETGAGESAYFSDTEYEQAGTTIISDPQLLYSGVDVILKTLTPPRDMKLR